MKTTPIFAALLFLLSAGHPTAGATLRTVALSGTTAPGTSDNFTGFGLPALNEAGQTAFFGSLDNIGATQTGIWSEGGGSGLALVARAGNMAPGTSDNFLTLRAPILNDAGQTAFGGRLDSGGITDGSIWSEGGGSGLALVAREGSMAPGTSDNFAGLGNSVLNNAGQTAFFGTLNNSGTDGSIWSEGGGSGLALVVREGDMAPGTSDNFVLLGVPVLNDAGQTAFRGRLDNFSLDYGIWSEGGGSGLALVAREGTTAPGTSDNFRDFDLLPALNNAGQTAFFGLLSSSTNIFGIWSEGGGSGLALVARAGNMAPGTSDNFTFLDNPVLNDAGQTAFFGTLNNSGTDQGIWSEGGGSGLALVARVGNMAPGTSDNFTSLSAAPVLNASGQTVLFGGLSGSSDTNTGIWAEDRSGILTLIARKGDLLDVDNGPGTDFRTISRLSSIPNTGNGDGRPSGFNNLGQLAFQADFTDGSNGVFVSNLVAIPEPTSLLLGALVAVGLLMRRRRPKLSI